MTSLILSMSNVRPPLCCLFFGYLFICLLSQYRVSLCTLLLPFCFVTPSHVDPRRNLPYQFLQTRFHPNTRLWAFLFLLGRSVLRLHSYRSCPFGIVGHFLGTRSSSNYAGTFFFRPHLPHRVSSILPLVTLQSGPLLFRSGVSEVRGRLSYRKRSFTLPFRVLSNPSLRYNRLCRRHTPKFLHKTDDTFLT